MVRRTATYFTVYSYRAPYCRYCVRIQISRLNRPDNYDILTTAI